MYRLFVITSYLLLIIEAKALFSTHKRNHLRATHQIRRNANDEVTSIQERPWQVSLENLGSMFCGGSIISPNYILTAAQCTKGLQPDEIIIRYGTDLLEEGGKTVAVSKIVYNSDFDYVVLDSDIAVLTLATAIPLSNSSKPVTLRKGEAEGGEIAVISGWGYLEEINVRSKMLHKLSLPVVDRKDCNETYNGKITENMICAGEPDVDSCEDEIGDAITIDDQQVGIESWGYGCGEGYPGVYSNIASLKQFIDENSNNEATWAERSK